MSARAACGTAAASLVLLVAAASLPGCFPSGESDVPASAAVRIPPRRAVTQAERQLYAGSAACIECHREYAGQLESHHALTLAAVTAGEHGDRFRKGTPRIDALNDVTYAPALRDGLPVLRAESGGRVAEAPALFAFGSGHRGMTFLGEYLGHAVELRLSHYAPRPGRTGGWDFTPGQPSAPGRRPPSGAL